MSAARKAADPAERAAELRKVPDHHGYRYYVLDDPESGDDQYDALIDELRQIEAEHPELVTPDSPTQRTGGEPVSELEKVRHPQAMLSLANARSADELRAWLRTPGVLRVPAFADRLESRVRQTGARTAREARELWEHEHWELEALDHLAEAYERGGVRAALRALQRQLHVGLTGGDPDLADQHVGEGQRVRTRDAQRERPARGERRQRQRLVVDDLDRGAAAADHDHRPEGWVVGDAGDQLAGERAALGGEGGDGHAREGALRALELDGGLDRGAGLQREALVLRYFADLPEQETAEAMGISRGTFKSTTARGLAALGRMLREDQ